LYHPSLGNIAVPSPEARPSYRCYCRIWRSVLVKSRKIFRRLWKLPDKWYKFRQPRMTNHDLRLIEFIVGTP
jgi:hypothetical protein